MRTHAKNKLMEKELSEGRCYRVHKIQHPQALMIISFGFSTASNMILYHNEVYKHPRHFLVKLRDMILSITRRRSKNMLG